MREAQSVGIEFDLTQLVQGHLLHIFDFPHGWIGFANAKASESLQTNSLKAKMLFFLKEKVCTSSWYKYIHTENLYYLNLLRLHKVTGLLHII